MNPSDNLRKFAAELERERDPLEKTYYHRAIQTNIGRALRAHYGEDFFSQPLPDKLRALLKQLDEQQSLESDKPREQNKPDR